MEGYSRSNVNRRYGRMSKLSISVALSLNIFSPFFEKEKLNKEKGEKESMLIKEYVFLLDISGMFVIIYGNSSSVACEIPMFHSKKDGKDDNPNSNLVEMILLGTYFDLLS